MNYEERVVLFLDILGFKNIIGKTYEGTIDDTEAIKSLYDKLVEIKSFLNSRLKTKFDWMPKTSYEITQFSDSIIISFVKNKENTIESLLSTIQSLLIKLGNSGIICRGAVSVGKLIHDSDIIFGPALNEAYETETRAALYPRVILDESIILFPIESDGAVDIEEIGKWDMRRSYLSQDVDGKLYIDYFSDKLDLFEVDAISYLTNLRSIIEDGLKYDKPDLKVKYGWMKTKYNKMLIELKGEKKIASNSKFIGLQEYLDELSPIK